MEKEKEKVITEYILHGCAVVHFAFLSSLHENFQKQKLTSAYPTKSKSI